MANLSQSSQPPPDQTRGDSHSELSGIAQSQFSPRRFRGSEGDEIRSGRRIVADPQLPAPKINQAVVVGPIGYDEFQVTVLQALARLKSRQESQDQEARDQRLGLESSQREVNKVQSLYAEHAQREEALKKENEEKTKQIKYLTKNLHDLLTTSAMQAEVLSHLQEKLNSITRSDDLPGLDDPNELYDPPSPIAAPRWSYRSLPVTSV
jgi:hypothetical protein